MMSKKSKYILSIAGFDPCGGAGLLADIKTFEQHGCIGMSVQTANTIQLENKFESVNWVEEKIVLRQLDLLLEVYNFKVVKVGLIPNLTFLKTVIDKCKLANSKTKIIWDPVLSGISGFEFKQGLTALNEVLKGLYLITPNWDEIKTLSGIDDSINGAEKLAKIVKVYLKGGHNETGLGKDFLFDVKTKQIFNRKSRNKTYYEKHGSGCIFSSALAANINNGHTLQKSCLKSKRYIENVLASSKELLGRHKL